MTGLFDFLAFRKLGTKDELLAYQFPELKDRILTKGYLTESEFDLAWREFKKWVWLVRETDKKLPMPSTKVDIVWHEFMLFSQEYEKFGKRFLGRYLHHVPESKGKSLSSLGYRDDVLVDNYLVYWGMMPWIWDIPSSKIEERANNMVQNNDGTYTPIADTPAHVNTNHDSLSDIGGHSSCGGCGSDSSCGSSCGGGCGSS